MAHEAMEKSVGVSHLMALLGGAAIALGGQAAFTSAVDPSLVVDRVALYRFNESDAGHQWAVEVRAAAYASPDASDPFMQGNSVREFDAAIPADLSGVVVVAKQRVEASRADAGIVTDPDPIKVVLFSAPGEDAGYGFEWCDKQGCVSGPLDPGPTAKGAAAGWWAAGKAKDAG